MVFSCSYCKRKCVKGIGCFSFPKDKRLCDQWLMACGFDVHPNNYTLKLKLCSFHFEDNCLITTHTGRKQLKPKCVPTIFHSKKKIENDLPFIKQENFSDEEETEFKEIDLVCTDIKMECEVDDQYNVNFLDDQNILGDPVVKSEPEESDEENLSYEPKLSEDFGKNMFLNINTKILKENDRMRKDKHFNNIYFVGT